MVSTATLFDDKVLGDKTPFIGEKGLGSNNFYLIYYVVIVMYYYKPIGPSARVLVYS